MTEFIKRGFPRLCLEHFVHALSLSLGHSPAHVLCVVAAWDPGLGRAAAEGLLRRRGDRHEIRALPLWLSHVTTTRTVCPQHPGVCSQCGGLESGVGGAPPEGAGVWRASPARPGCWLRPSHLRVPRSLPHLHTPFSACPISLCFPSVRIHVIHRTAFRAVIEDNLLSQHP